MISSCTISSAVCRLCGLLGSSPVALGLPSFNADDNSLQSLPVSGLPPCDADSGLPPCDADDDADADADFRNLSMLDSFSAACALGALGHDVSSEALTLLKKPLILSYHITHDGTA